MFKLIGSVLGVIVWLGVVSSTAPAQNPTYSLEATAINGIPLAGGTTNRISVAPGDTITLELYLRDWSPDGEVLRAYQAALDTDGYTSGGVGEIKPVDYDATTGKQDENKENCFVDRTNPLYVLKGAEEFALTDTRSPGYRWLGIIIHEVEGLISAQDGKKSYCGTVHMKVSDDAVGSFRLRLRGGQGNSTIRDPASKAIIPLDLEDCIVDVRRGTVRIVSSDPPGNAIDARTRPSGHADGGWTRIALTFSGDTVQMTTTDFAVDDGTATSPRVTNVAAAGSTITLLLDRPVQPGRWTTITHRDSGTLAIIGCLPGDVNNDGTLDAQDLAELLNPSDEAGSRPMYRTDIDHDGATGTGDVLALLDLLTKPGAYHSPTLEPVAR